MSCKKQVELLLPLCYRIWNNLNVFEIWYQIFRLYPLHLVKWRGRVKQTLWRFTFVPNVIQILYLCGNLWVGLAAYKEHENIFNSFSVHINVGFPFIEGINKSACIFS